MIENLWRMSIYGTVLILAVLAVRFLLKKYPKVYSCTLWLFVLIRLLCPVFIQADYSLQPNLQGAPVQEHQILGETGKRKAESRKTTENGEAAQPVPESSEAYAFPRLLFIKLVYLAGLGITAAVFLILFLCLKKRVETAVLDRKNVWLCDGIPSAFVMGLFRPQIYLPYGLEALERRYVVKHEEIHIRHGDPWVRALGTAALCLHWWNPAVWYAVHKMHQDMEMCCDESVMERASMEERKTYAGILLKFSAERSGLFSLAFNESNTEKRIQNILRGKKKRTVFLVLFFSLFSVVCGGAFMTVPRFGHGGISGTDSEQGKNMVTREYSVEEMPVYLERVILSDTPVNSAGRIRYIQLVMTEGEYFTEEYAGAGGGTFAENYRGTYELWGLDENRGRIFRYPLQDESGGTVFNFGEAFELALADYNADGCADFTLGTWGSSSMGLYYLYTLTEKGEILQAYPEAIADSGLSFSRRFELADAGFMVHIYHNDTGEYRKIPYRWEETQGKYVMGEETSESDGGTETF